jgi:hypothetical protein
LPTADFYVWGFFVRNFRWYAWAGVHQLWMDYDPISREKVKLLRPTWVSPWMSLIHAWICIFSPPSTRKLRCAGKKEAILVKLLANFKTLPFRRIWSFILLTQISLTFGEA